MVAFDRTAARDAPSACAIDCVRGARKLLCPVYRVGQKGGHKLMTIILSNLNRFKNCFSLEDSSVNLQLNAY